MTLLLIGGTAEARQIATILHERGVPVLYSIVGLVRKTKPAYPVISGGFNQFGGLAKFIEQRNIKAILDATHPYAEKMSSTSVRVAKECNIPCWRFQRPAWETQPGDDWRFPNSWEDMLPELFNFKRLFFSVGQLNQDIVDSIKPKQQALLRTAVEPSVILPEHFNWIKAIGPFDIENERALLKQYQIDVVISKNSGGDSVSAKLFVARELSLPVFMLKRPILETVGREFSDSDSSIEACWQWFKEFQI